MRMWMVPPETMCRKHLLGEHVELHMFVGTINKGISVEGFLANNLIEPRSWLSGISGGKIADMILCKSGISGGKE